MDGILIIILMPVVTPIIYTVAFTAVIGDMIAVEAATVVSVSIGTV
jgi:hypothetical protein